MRKILLVKGKSRYNAMRNYIDELAKGFRKMGYDTLILDTTKRNFSFYYENVVKSKEFDVVLTCNGLGMEDIDFYQPNKTQLFISYFFDHPSYHYLRLEACEENHILIFNDDKHVRYMKKYYPEIQVEFVPMAGKGTSYHVPYRERKIDLIFTGSYYKPDKQMKLIEPYGDSMRFFYEGMIDKILQNTELTIDEVLEQMVNQYKIEITEKEMRMLLSQFCIIDEYARNYYRDKVIRTLLEAGIKIHVYGGGWENFESTNKECLIIERGNSEVARRALGDAKMALNIFPWFRHGFQERIASAMLSGAVSITDENEYVKEEFDDGENIILYSLKELEKLPQKIKRLLDNPDEAERIAQKGREKAKKQHTWDCCTREIANIIEAYYHRDIKKEGGG